MSHKKTRWLKRKKTRKRRFVGKQLLLAFRIINKHNNVTINSNLNILGITKCNKQLNLVNLSQNDINNLSNINNGDIIFNTTTNKINIYARIN
jgi:hypothetical protein